MATGANRIVANLNMIAQVRVIVNAKKDSLCRKDEA